MVSPSSSFMAILPARFTLAKSDSLLRRTSPDLVANMMSRSAHAASSSGIGRTFMMVSPGSIGSRLTKALPRDWGLPSGRRQVFSL